MGGAITPSSRLATWGGDASCLGGYLGNGTSDRGSSTTYVIDESMDTLMGVIATSMGFGGGVAITTTGLVAWGCNDLGELANGTSDTELSAIEVTLPTGVSYADPYPQFLNDLVPTEDCIENITGNELSLNTTIPVDMLQNYELRWYANDLLISSGAPLGGKEAISITEPGLYRAELEYIGSSNGCTTYPVASSQAVISVSSDPYELTTAVYCGADGAVQIDQVNFDRNQSYQWYEDPAGDFPIGTSSPSQLFDFSLSSGPEKTIYLEPILSTETTLFAQDMLCEPDSSRNVILGKGTFQTLDYQTLIEVKEKSTLRSFKGNARMELFIDGSSYEGVVKVGIFAAQILNPDIFPQVDTSNGGLIKKVEVPFAFQRNGAESIQLRELAFNFNVELDPGYYLITFTREIFEADASNGGIFGFLRGECTFNYPIADDGANETLASIEGMVLGFRNPRTFRPGASIFYDFEFIKEDVFCGIREVELDKLTQILEFTNPGEVCEGEEVTMTVSTNSTTPAFTWYKNDIPLPGITSGSLTVPAQKLSEGQYYVEMTDECGTEFSPESQLVVFTPSISSEFTIDNDQLTGPAGADSYLWLLNDTDAPGTNDEQVYEFAQSGFYSLVITEGPGCVDTSLVQPVVVTSVESSLYSDPIRVFPVPAHNILDIVSNDLILEINLISPEGRVINIPCTPSKEMHIGVGGYPMGNYHLVVRTEGQLMHRPIHIIH